MSDEQKITVDEDVNLGPGFDLYRVNDALTALASTIGVKWASDEAEDDALNTATYAVAEAFGLPAPIDEAEAEAVVVVTYDPDVFENPRAVAEYLHNTAVEQQDGIGDVSTYTSPTAVQAEAEAAVVLVGTLSDGYRAFGPFGDFDAAAEWADSTRTTAIGEPSWVMTLNEAQAGGGA